MEKKLSCRAMGLNCDYTIHAETEEEIVEAIAKHLKNVHAIVWTDELRAKAGDLVRLAEAS